MCAIFGALVWNIVTSSSLKQVNETVNHIFRESFARGRDGRGYQIRQVFKEDIADDLEIFRNIERKVEWDGQEIKFVGSPQWTGNKLDEVWTAALIGNMRAEPTTEHVAEKNRFDQQPYHVGPWTIVHNGTIANDHELRNCRHPTRIDSAAIAEHLANDHMEDRPAPDVAAYFEERIRDLKGSYAILAMHDEHPGMILVACNYRPIWWATGPKGIYFASARDYFPDNMVPQMVEPYSAWAYYPEGRVRLSAPRTAGKRALVVCSGGLDSVVAATKAQADGYDISLLHFMYGSRAEGPEVNAVIAVAEALEVPFQLFPLPIYKPADSPLLQKDSTIAGGEAGAEFAHEWVPARNLAMLSIATALAEAGGYDTIILGNNLEEAGAYPDNEPEFIARFNDLLPFAVGDGKRVEVLMPVGNLMKHEIVALGHELGAPLDRTWSCYRAGEQHCGTCGPCFMRRTAFKINGLTEVIPYANEE